MGRKGCKKEVERHAEVENKGKCWDAVCSGGSKDTGDWNVDRIDRKHLRAAVGVNLRETK